MAVADLVAEVFEDEAIRGPLATRGVLYTSTGPWAAGSAAVFLMDSAGNDGGAPGQSTIAKGGSGALAAALEASAKAYGVTIRTGADVAEIRSRDGRVVGVTLADGESIDAGTVVSAADPKRTLALCDPVELGPTMVWRASNIRQPGATAKVNLALSDVPSFNGADDVERLKGRIVIGTSIDHVERAKDAVKFGHIAEEPWLEATIPTLSDPSLAPEGKHVMSILVEAAPRNLRDGDWSTERERLGDVTVKALEQYAPGLGELIEARQVITPEDFEHDYGLSGGHVYHAEPGLDQFFMWRPLNGQARYRFVLDGLFLAGPARIRAGGDHGRAGRERRAADPERSEEELVRHGLGASRDERRPALPLHGPRAGGETDRAVGLGGQPDLEQLAQLGALALVERRAIRRRRSLARSGTGSSSRRSPGRSWGCRSSVTARR